MPPTPTIDRQIIAQLSRESVEKLGESQVAINVGQMLIRDGHTGLYNRRYVQERLPLQLAAAATDGRPVSLLMLDLNRFKQINDTLGHAAGDRLLVAAARVLEQLIPSDGFAARYGGDEFIVVLVGREKAEVEGFALSVLEALGTAEVQLETNQSKAGLTGSIGIATWPQDGLDYATLFVAADQAMYHAKHARGGGVCNYASLRATVGIRSVLPPKAAPLEGRAREWTVLDEVARHGDRVVCIAGPPGMGMSRLGREAAAEARKRGWAVLTVRAAGDRSELSGLSQLLHTACDQPELRPTLLAGLAALPEATRIDLEQILPRQFRSDERAGERLAVASPERWGSMAEELITQVVKEQPLWLFINDLHHWDEISLRFVLQLAVNGTGPRLAVVATVGEGDAASTALIDRMRVLERERFPVTLLTLEPLSEKAAASLIRNVITGRVELTAIEALLSHSGGNPGQLLQLVSRWTEEGLLRETAGAWDLVEEPGLPPGPVQVGRGLEDVGADLWPIVEALSVSSRPWPFEQLCHLLAHNADQVSLWLDQLRVLGILMLEGSTYRFTNQATRREVLGRLHPVNRRLWHRRLAEIWEQDPPSEAAIAEQWEEASDHLAAARWHLLAAERAERLGVARAAGEHFMRAAECQEGSGQHDPAAAKWWQRAGLHLGKAGHSAQALACYQRVLRDTDDPEERASLLNSMIYLGRILLMPEIRVWAQDVFELLKDRPTSSVLIDAFSHLAWIDSYWDGNLKAALDHCNRGVEVARVSGTTDQQAYLMLRTAMVYHGLGQQARALRLAREVGRRPGNNDQVRSWVEQVAAVVERDPGRQLEATRSRLEQVKALGDVHLVLVSYSYLLPILCTLGRWEEARVTFEEWRRAAWLSGTPTVIRSVYLTWGEYMIQRGLYDEVESMADRVQELTSKHQMDPFVPVYLNAALSLARGDAAKALSQVNECAITDRPCRFETAGLYFVAAQAALQLGRADAAEEWLGHACRSDSITAGPWSIHERKAWLTGWIAEQRGDFVRALFEYGRARRVACRRWEKVRAYLSESSLRVRIGADLARAHHLARQGLRLAKRQGYVTLQAEAQRLLASTHASHHQEVAAASFSPNS